MADFRRYAVYWAPEDGSALARFGADWFGWDAGAGVEVAGRGPDGLPIAREEIVARPRRYGFHATLKPPLELAEGRGFAEFDGEVARIVDGFAAFELPPLRLSEAGGFLAIVPEHPSQELAALAEACIIELDGFRAPAGAEELARRRAVGLTPEQEALLGQWGYPYVLDAFEFHLTLTGPLAPEIQAGVRAALEPTLAGLLGETVTFAEIGIYGEGEDGMFRRVARHRLRTPTPG